VSLRLSLSLLWLVDQTNSVPAAFRAEVAVFAGVLVALPIKYLSYLRFSTALDLPQPLRATDSH
jgi:hypothetical protein